MSTPSLCEHLRAATDAKVTPSGAGCEDCLAIGGRWVHLRLCLSCGRVGCCDESPNRHASKHARKTKHHVIRSFEPGESWLYCFAHDLGIDP